MARILMIFLASLILACSSLVSAEEKPSPVQEIRQMQEQLYPAAVNMFATAAAQFNRRVDESEKYNKLPKSERPYVTERQMAEQMLTFIQRYQGATRLFGL